MGEVTVAGSGGRGSRYGRVNHEMWVGDWQVAGKARCSSHPRWQNGNGINAQAYKTGTGHGEEPVGVGAGGH